MAKARSPAENIFSRASVFSSAARRCARELPTAADVCGPAVVGLLKRPFRFNQKKMLITNTKRSVEPSWRSARQNRSLRCGLLISMWTICNQTPAPSVSRGSGSPGGPESDIANGAQATLQRARQAGAGIEQHAGTSTSITVASARWPSKHIFSQCGLGARQSALCSG